LLDIKMPGLTGLELLEALGQAAPIVIFVTAFDRFALDAFERAAFDYLLKPVEPARLAASLARAREALADRAASERVQELEEILHNLRSGPEPAPAAGFDRDIWIQERGGRICLPVAAIDWVAAERDYVRIHAGARSFLVRQSIGALAERLDPKLFVRIHRSSLVRAERIVRVRHAAGRGSVTLSTGAEVAVSRRHMGALNAIARQRLAPGSRQGRDRRLAQHRAAEPVGDDQAGLLRQDLARELRRDREGEGVAIGLVLVPLLVGAEVLETGLHLDDEDLAAPPQRHQVGAPSVRQRHFGQRRIAQRRQQPTRPAGDRGGGLRPGDGDDGDAGVHASRLFRLRSGRKPLAYIYFANTRS
jgi:DNA-binding LytR/AlgR family response regulator